MNTLHAIPRVPRRRLGCAVCALLACLLAASPAWAGTGGIDVRLEPREVVPGESADLSITVEGGAAAGIELPHVDGLHFAPTGRSTRMRSINGELTSSETRHYEVRAARTGRFTIGPVEVRVGGETLRSDPVELAVSDAPRRAAPAPGNDSAEPADAAEHAFLRIEPAVDTAYVGQIVPVAITAWFKRGVGVESLSRPVLEGTAFALHDLPDEPKQAVEMVNGERYVVLTWDATLSTVKEGSHDLGIGIESTLSVPVSRSRPRKQRRRRPGSLLDDPFFGDDPFDRFFQRKRSIERPLRSEARSFEVKALPTEGRPADFRGAVGTFFLSAAADPRMVAAGDPVTLEATISGRGNFDRVARPSLGDDAAFKIYPGKHAFTPWGEGESEGVKRFAWSLIPQRGGDQPLPPVTLSYFNPDTEAYVTLRAEPLSVHVTGSLPATGAAADGPVTAASAGPAGLARNRARPGTRAEALGSLGLEAFATGVLLLLLLVGLALRLPWFGPNGSRARERRLRAGQAEATTAMDRAIEAGNARRFFAALRKTIALAGLDPARGSLPELFAAADACSYARQTFDRRELRLFKTELDRTLDMEVSR